MRFSPKTSWPVPQGWNASPIEVSGARNALSPRSKPARRGWPSQQKSSRNRGGISRFHFRFDPHRLLLDRSDLFDQWSPTILQWKWPHHFLQLTRPMGSELLVETALKQPDCLPPGGCKHPWGKIKFAPLFPLIRLWQFRGLSATAQWPSPVNDVTNSCVLCNRLISLSSPMTAWVRHR